MVTPEPTRTGIEATLLILCSSAGSAACPVAQPVKTMPSERKNCAALAVSSKDKSLVIECELKN